MSRALPAYAFGRNPEQHVILASYAADLSSRMNRDVQRIIDTPEYQRAYPDVKLQAGRTPAGSTYQRNNDLFEIVGHKGSYRSAGVGGGITGHGFNLGIIDDPFKNRKEANSPTVRNAVWEWYTSTFYTRQEDDAALIVIMTRWHSDDLAGRLLKAMEDPDEDTRDFAEHWDVLSFPAIAKEARPAYDPRQPGEALWPAKHSIDQLRRINRAIGDYDFSALFDQSPTPQGGGLFKRDKFKLIDAEPAGITKRVRFWDLATSEKTSADYTAGELRGLTANRDEVVLDMRRGQIDWDAVPDFIVKTALVDGPKVEIGIEKAFIQSRAVKAVLKRPELHNYSIRGYEPESDKWTRALPAAARVGEGMVYVLNRAWTEDYLTEMCAFPFGGNDDQVDADSGAHLMLEARQPLVVTPKVYA